MQSCTRGEPPGAPVVGELASVPPGAVGGRGAPTTPFQGHMVSFKLWPTGLPLTGLKVATALGLKRLFRRCHLAHSRSTCAWSRKKSGSRAAVGMLLMDPPK